MCIISSFIYAHFAAYRHADPENDYLMIAFESAFLLDFLMNFILDFPDPKDPKFKSVRKIGEISTHYYHGSFWTDFTALMPLHLLKM